MSKIVETDNFGGDYPNERELNLPRLSQERAEKIAQAINDAFPDDYPSYWKVVDDDYRPKRGLCELFGDDDE